MRKWDRTRRRFVKSPFDQPLGGPGGPFGGGGGLPGWSSGMDLWRDWQTGAGNMPDPTEGSSATRYALKADGTYQQFTGTQVTRTNLGLQTVPTRTNLTLQPRNYADAAWTKQGSAIVTVGASSAFGDNLAYTFTGAGSSSALRNTTALTVVVSSTYAASRLVKRGNTDWIRFTVADTALTNGVNCWFNLATGAAGSMANTGTGYGYVSHGIQGLGNGWYLVYIVVTAPVTDAMTRMLSASADASLTQADVGSGAGVSVTFLIDNSDFTLGTFPVPPIITTGAVSGNQLAVPNLGTQFATGVAGFLQLLALGTDAGLSRAIELNDGTSGNRLYVYNSGGNWVLRIEAGGVTQASVTLGPVTVGTIQTAAFVGASNYVMGRLVGQAAPAPDTAATWPVIDRIAFGGQGYNAAGNGYQRTYKIALDFLAPGDDPATAFANAWAKAQLAATQGMPVLALRGTVVPWGDSFVANNSSISGAAITTYSSGVSVWAEAISLGKVAYDHANNKGVSGETTAQVLARILSGAAATAAATGFWTLDCGRNDSFASDAARDATILALKDAAVSLYVLTGRPGFIFTPNPPRGSGFALSGAERTRANYVNAAMKAFCATQPNMRYVDYFADWDSGDGNTPKANYTYDGLHASRIGAYWAARRFWAEFGALFPARANAPILTNYNSGTNPLGNLLSILGATVPQMLGNGGQKFNCQGNLADGYVFGRLFGANNNNDINLSKIDRGGGTSFKQRIEFGFTGGAMAGDFTGQCVGGGNTFGGRPVTPAELLSKTIGCEYMMDVSGAVGFGIPSIQMVARNNSVSVTATGMSHLDGMANNVFSIPDGTYLLKSPGVPVAGVDTSPTFWPDPIMAALTGAKATVDLYDATVNRLN